MTTVDLAGWRVRLVCEPEALARSVAARYAAFAQVSAPAEADLIAEITLEPRLPQMGGTSHQPASISDVSVEYTWDQCLIDSPMFRGRVEFIPGKAALSFSSERALADLEYFLRIVYACLAFRQGGLMVHAAGVLVGGVVHLFTGRSGSGKSTVVALSPGAVALNDDLVLLRKSYDGWRVHGTPFWNAETLPRAAETASGALGGIYRLVQDRDVYLEAMPVAAATAELAANCPVINGQSGVVPDLLARCAEVVRAVPVRRLHFRKEPGFWSLLDPRPGLTGENR